MKKTQKIHIKKSQVDRLISDIIGLPISPIGDHLSDKEFSGYVKETLPDNQIKNIDNHLSSCSKCASKMERLFEKPETWWEKKGEPQFASNRQKILDKARLPEFLEREKLQACLVRLLYPMALSPAFRAHDPLDFESEDGTYGVFIEEKPNGDVKVYLDSTATELEGVTIRLYAGKWSKDVRLTKVDDTQLGAKVIITRAEREAMPQGAVLRAKLVDEKD